MAKRSWRPAILAVSFATIISVCYGLGGSSDTAHAQAPSVYAVHDSRYGDLLTDGSGFTLYVWAGDEPGQSNCYGGCAAAWPPYTLDDEPVAPEGLPGELGVVAREDGYWQLTFNDWPLYYFSGDTEAGDVDGDSLGLFGATWSVMAFGGSAAVQSYDVSQFANPAPPLLFQAPEQTLIPYTSPFTTTGPASTPPPPGSVSAYAPQPLMPAIYSAPSSYSPTLTVVSPRNGIVSLSWVAIPNAVSYRIYRSAASSTVNLSVGQTIQQPTGQMISSSVITSLNPGNTYYIQVRAVDPSGVESVVPSMALVGLH